MVNRRQVSMSLISMLAALTVPVTARAMPRFNLLHLPVDSDSENQNLTEGQVRDFDGTVIKVIGVGGGGCNAVEHMIQSAVGGVEFICADTDDQDLSRCSAHKVIQLGSSGMTAGGKPDKGREAADLAESDIREAIQGAHMLFITAGMGGGTGTGAVPIIARVAKDMGILTVGVVTKPFDFEGGRRISNADSGLTELEGNVDSLIVVQSENLLDVLGDDIGQDEAFAQVNEVLKNAVGGIAEVINVRGYVGIDFEDVRTVMGESGKTMMGSAVAEGPGRSRLAAERALAFPLTECFDHSVANGAFVLISASKGSLRLSESKLAMNIVRERSSVNAQLIYGTYEDDSLGEQLRVTVFSKV